MILATTTVEDVDRFLKVFGTKGADKRALHGSKGSVVYRDPTEENRMWVLFEWDERAGRTSCPTPRSPPMLKEAGHLAKPRDGLGARPVPGVGGRATMTSAISRPARVGLITDQTGALSFMGIANVNLATMVIDDINARGGLLGRPGRAVRRGQRHRRSRRADGGRPARPRGRRRRGDRRDLQLDPPGDQGPGGRRGRKLYLYPEQYEGQESHP